MGNILEKGSAAPRDVVTELYHGLDRAVVANRGAGGPPGPGCTGLALGVPWSPRGPGAQKTFEKKLEKKPLKNSKKPLIKNLAKKRYTKKKVR